MNDLEFFPLYIPALEKALENDDKNCSFSVKGPDFYIDKYLLNLVYSFIDNNINKFKIFDMVGLYFDSKSHHFPDVGALKTEDYKNLLLEEISLIKAKYKLSN